MITTMSSNKINTFEELRLFLEMNARATECHVYPYGYKDEETSEDPIKVLHGVEETIEWIKENPACVEWGEMTGYLVVVFNRDGFYREVIF